jgi:hypothetical protein
MKKKSEDSLFDKPAPPKDIEFPEIWFQAVEQLRGMDEVNRAEIPEADVKKLYKELLDKMEMRAGRENLIYEKLTQELEKKYPKGSSVPSREIDLAIVNADTPRPLDEREAYDAIYYNLKEDGRKIAFTMCGIREFPRLSPGTKIEAKSTSTYAHQVYRGTVINNPYGDDYKTILRVKLDNGNEMYLHAGTLDYIKRIGRISMKSIAKKFKYDPVLLDKMDPKVLSGSPIAQGATVVITKSNIDPMRKFVFVQDEKGNAQSVYKNSLTPIAQRIKMSEAVTAQGSWWEGRKFKHPETGHMVIFKSLPLQEQKRLNELIKNKETEKSPKKTPAPPKAPAKPDPKTIEKIKSKLEAEGVDPQDYQKAVDTLSQTVAGPGLVNVYKKFVFKQPQKPLTEMSKDEIDDLGEEVKKLGDDLSDEANELMLYAENDGDLYRQRETPVTINLLKKIKSGKYDSALSPKLWKYYADDSAKKYQKEFGTKISVEDRKAMANYLAKNFEHKYAMGEFDTFGGKTYGNQSEKYWGKKPDETPDEGKTEKPDIVNGKEVHIWDNGGETADRYTVQIGEDVFTMSENSNAPNGVNMYSGDISELPGVGTTEGEKKINLKSLPPEVQKSIDGRARDEE